MEIDAAPRRRLDRPILRPSVEMDPGETEQAAHEPGGGAGRRARSRTTGSGARQGSSGQVATLPVAVPLADLSGWVQIRRDLDGLPEVRSVRVDSFTQSEARMTIGYLGELERWPWRRSAWACRWPRRADGWRLRPAGGLAMFGALPYRRYALSVLAPATLPTC